MPVLATVAGRRTDSMEDFMQEFADSITDLEWRTLAELPALERTTQLITVVGTLRTLLAAELPAGHPLAAAGEVTP